MRKNTGGGCSGHDKCLPMPACDVADSTSSFCKATQFPRTGVTEETVVLGDFLIQTLLESEIKLASYATDIKHIKKNVHLTQCKALPIPGVNNVVNLFVEGYIHKNIQYVEDCDGCVKDYSVDVPFSCFKRVELARPVVFPFGEHSMKENVLEMRELAKDGMGADRCTFGSLTFEINNEPITCKLLASTVHQWDILQNFDKWGRFDKVTEKSDVILAIKLTQKQEVIREVPSCIYEVIDSFEFPAGVCNDIGIGDIICQPCEDTCSELFGCFRVQSDSFCGLLMSRLDESCQTCPPGAKTIPPGFVCGPLIPPDAPIPEEQVCECETTEEQFYQFKELAKKADQGIIPVELLKKHFE